MKLQDIPKDGQQFDIRVDASIGRDKLALIIIKPINKKEKRCRKCGHKLKGNLEKGEIMPLQYCLFCRECGDIKRFW